MPNSPFKNIPRPAPEDVNKPFSWEGNAYLAELCAQGAPLEYIKEALAMGADPDNVNNKGLTALGVAIAADRPEIAQHLIKAGARLFFPLNNGRFFNALAMAVLLDRKEIAALLLKERCAPALNNPGTNALGSIDLPPLAVAVESKNYTLIQVLIAAGAFINAETGIDRLTPLMRAATQTYVASIDALIASGAALNVRSSLKGETALFHAVKNSRSSNAEALLKAGADPNIPNADGITPLMLAVREQKYQLIDLLIKFGSDANFQPANGNRETALHIAARTYNDSLIETLLRAGANPLLTDAFNRTASRIAYKEGTARIGRRLEEAERKLETEFFDKINRRLGR